MSSSKKNANLISDAIIKLTGDPFKTVTLMESIAKSNNNFNKILFYENKKVIKTILLEGLPNGILKIKNDRNYCEFTF